jgi:hypothetical protein
MPRNGGHRRRRRGRSLQRCKHLSPPQILAWADAHHERTDRWPQVYTGFVYNGPLDEKWRGERRQDEFAPLPSLLRLRPLEPDFGVAGYAHRNVHAWSAWLPVPASGE